MTRFEVLIKETAKILYFGCFWLYVGLNSSPIDNTTGCANKADFWLHFFCGELGTFLKMYAISKKLTLFIRNLSSCWDRDNNDGIWRNGENKRWFGLKSNLASHIPPHCWLIVVSIEKSQSNGFFSPTRTIAHSSTWLVHWVNERRELGIRIWAPAPATTTFEFSIVKLRRNRFFI